MKLVIYTNSNFEEEKALFDIESKKVILYGDYYHDKIDEKIEGYIKALNDFNIYPDTIKKIKEVCIDEDHEHYSLINFQE